MLALIQLLTLLVSVTCDVRGYYTSEHEWYVYRRVQVRCRERLRCSEYMCTDAFQILPRYEILKSFINIKDCFRKIRRMVWIE